MAPGLRASVTASYTKTACQHAEKRHQDSAPARRKEAFSCVQARCCPFVRAGALFLVPLETVLYELLKDAGAARQHAEKRHQDSAPARRKEAFSCMLARCCPFVRAGALFLAPLETVLYELLKDAGTARQHAGKRHQDSAPA